MHVAVHVDGGIRCALALLLCDTLQLAKHTFSRILFRYTAGVMLRHSALSVTLGVQFCVSVYYWVAQFEDCLSKTPAYRRVDRRCPIGALGSGSV